MTSKKTPTRLMSLTPEQSAAMAPYAQGWIRERGWRTAPLTEAEWAAFGEGVRDCYRFAKLDPPKTIVRVPSPLVGALAAPAAALAIQMIRRGAVDGAVGDAVGGAVRDAVRRLWPHRFGGNLWVGGWYYSLAYLCFFRDIVHLDLSDEIWDKLRAWDAANSAAWWWPFRDFVMVCDVPEEIHVEQVAPAGWGSHRLHCETGPAVSWPGFAVHAWHGTIVPADLIDGDGWSIERIISERNTEVRRAAVERMGWDVFIDRSGAELIAEAADPGNAPHTLQLYELPAYLEQSFSEPARIVLCTNGSQERDGTRHRYGITVRKRFSDPVAAMADTYGIPTDVYRRLEVRR